MASNDRTERYTNIINLLDEPFEQAPNPHKILHRMLMSERKLNLMLTNEDKPWNLLAPVTLPSVIGQTEYTIAEPASANQNSGKLYMVLRSTADSQMPYISVPFDDFNDLDYGVMPPSVNASFWAPEKVSVYRQDSQNQTRKVVITPTPTEVLSYQLWFYPATLDRAFALMTGTAAIEEASDWLDLDTAISLLPVCRWTDDKKENQAQAQFIGAGLTRDFQMVDKIITEYIKQINGAKSFDLDYALD